ncbi:MAG TPA: DNA-3-methyladenine glycosylase 2 family protein [Actinomycetota bacterium]
MDAQLRVMPSPGPVDLARTLFPLRRGTGDPTMRIGIDQAWRATRTPDGPATVHLQLDPSTGAVLVQTWGTGAAWALDHAPGLAGLLDDDRGFEPVHEVIRQLHRRLRGVRLTRTERPMEALIPAVMEQKVTGMEARRAYRRLSVALAEPAPGPADGLLLPPDPAAVAALPYHAFHPFGLERRRAEVIRHLCTNATAIEALAALPGDEARARFTTYPGVGEWTAAEVARLALGDADAISVGDYHLKNVVAWALAREPRGTDERMLELLEPYRGHRGRVQLLLEAGDIHAPKYGPRMQPAAIERI